MSRSLVSSAAIARIVYVTTPPAEAVPLARILVEKKLAGCVQLSDVQSIYTWQGKVEEQPETRLTIKTVANRLDELVKVIRDKHSFDCPQILVVNVDETTKDYLDWLEDTAKA